MHPGGPRVPHVSYLPVTVEEDVGSSLALLADRLEDAGALLPSRERILACIAEGTAESRYPLTPQRIVHDVRQVMPEDGIVCLDNGMYKIWFARNYRTRVANTLLLNNALATMRAGLLSAIAAAILYPYRRVLAVCGDGGFMMNSQELEAATGLGLNLVALILQDNAYGMIRWKQAGDGFPDFGMSFGNPDFVTYAKAYGARGSRMESADRLMPALEAAFDGGGIHVVAVPVDYSENMRVLVDELRAPRIEPRRAIMIEVVQAFDRATTAELDPNDAAALDRKIEIAGRLFANRSGRLKPYRRIEILRKLAGLMEDKREHLGLQIAREGGKPLTDALIETDRAIDGVRNAVDELRVMGGREIPMGLTLASIDRRAFTIIEPIRVVAAISAFNHPLDLIVHQVVPAIAAGCPVIVKAAPASPFSCVDFVRLLHEVGLSPDWCQTLLPETNELAEALATDPRIAFLSFIGSSRVGW
jgi:hypothetical protein